MKPKPTSSPKAGNGFGGPLPAVSLTVFLDLVGFGMILPLLPFYAELYGASPFEIGLLFASYSLAQFVCSPLWGRLSDRIGRRTPLLASIVLSCLAYVLLAAAPTLGLVFLARILAGAAAANYTIAQALVADVTAPEKRARAMGWLGAAFGLGFVVGPALGGGLSHLGVTAVPAGAAVMAAINFALVWRTVPETRQGAGADREARQIKVWAALANSRRLTSIVVCYGLVIFGFSAMEATLALFCERRLDFGIRKTALLFVFVGLLMVLVQAGLIGKLVDRFSESRVLAAGLLSMTAGMLTLSEVDSIALLLPAIALIAIGSALYHPTALSLMSQLAPTEARGGTLGLARSLGALARVGGPIWGGWAFYRLGDPTPFLSAGMLLVLLFLAAFWTTRRYGSAPASQPIIGESL